MFQGHLHQRRDFIADFLLVRHDRILPDDPISFQLPYTFNDGRNRQMHLMADLRRRLS